MERDQPNISPHPDPFPSFVPKLPQIPEIRWREDQPSISPHPHPFPSFVPNPRKWMEREPTKHFPTSSSFSCLCPRSQEMERESMKDSPTHPHLSPGFAPNPRKWRGETQPRISPHPDPSPALLQPQGRRCWDHPGLTLRDQLRDPLESLPAPIPSSSRGIQAGADTTKDPTTPFREYFPLCFPFYPSAGFYPLVPFIQVLSTRFLTLRKRQLYFFLYK